MFSLPVGSCRFIKCSNKKSCIEDQNSQPQCTVCPRCSNSNKNLTHQMISKMVCGADGVTYRSMCNLRQRSCKLGKSIAFLHRGPCTGTFGKRDFCNIASEKYWPQLAPQLVRCCQYKILFKKSRLVVNRKWAIEDKHLALFYQKLICKLHRNLFRI